jgi:hypothetical protein
MATVTSLFQAANATGHLSRNCHDAEEASCAFGKLKGAGKILCLSTISGFPFEHPGAGGGQTTVPNRVDC